MRRRCVFRNLAVAALAAALSSAAQAQQLPANGRLVAGSGSIAQTGNTLTVTQTSPRLIADWQSFNIGSQSSVVFNQPNAAAVALNRVTGTTPSMIDGALRANGQVFLLNPNGVLFGNGARVDVGALVASSLQMSNADFLAGNYRLNAGPFAGTVSNAGRINASGGVVALIAPSVSNTGQITADKGSVALAAGNAVNLDFVGDGLVNIKVEQGAIDALVENKGLIQADGGRVVMTTQAAQDLFNNVVNNEGVVQARTLENREGRILLSASTSLGEAKAGGTLDVSASAGQGGKIQVFGDKVSVETAARLDATGAQGGGEILIGGGWQGSGGYPQATRVFVARDAVLDASATASGNGGSVVAWSDVSNPLSQTRVYGSMLAKGGANGGDGGRIETSGHWLDVAGITANASAAKGKGGEWLLDPYDLTVTGGATTAGTALGPPYVFSSGIGGSNVLNTDIVAQLNGGTSVTLQTTGVDADGFGAGDINVNASISKTAGGNATLKLVAHHDIVIASGVSIGSSVGNLDVVLNSDSDTLNGGKILLDGSTGAVTLNSFGGNIVMGGGTCSTASCTAPAIASVAFDPGISLAGSSGNLVTLSSGTGTIWLRGEGNAGGGAGISASYASLTNSGAGSISFNGTGHGVTVPFRDGIYFDPSTSISAGTGGLALTGASDGSPANGVLLGGTVTVTGNTTVNGGGADVGLGDPVSNFTGSVSVSNTGNLTITAASALTLGTISTTGTIGVSNGSGDLTLSGNISTTDATANAIFINAGAGSSFGTATGGDIKLSGSPTISVGFGGAAQLLTGSVSGTTAGTTTWAATLGGAGRYRYNSDGFTSNFSTAIGTGTYLIYREQPTITVTASDENKTYDGAQFSGGSVSYSGFVNSETSSVMSGSPSYGGSSQGAVNVGNYLITPSGLSNGLGYAISYANGSLTIGQASLTVSANSKSKTYDGVPFSGGNGVSYSGFVNGEGEGVLSGGVSYGGNSQGAVNLGSYAITPGGLSSNNYAISYADGTLDIAGAPLTITASSLSKPFSGVAFKGGNGASYSGFVGGDTSSVLSGTLSYGGTSQGAMKVGDYSIIPSGLSSSKYIITFAEGKLTLTPAPLTITASDVSKVYGQTVTLTGFTQTGLVSGDKIDSVVLTSTGTTAKAGVAGGPYAITPSAATGSAFDAKNYTIAYVNGKLAVTPAPLTVTAGDVSKVYGQTATLTGFTQTGLVNGDKIDAVVLTSAGADAKAGVAGGPYAVTPSAAAGAAFDARNYTVAYANGKLTVTPAPLTVTASDVGKLYGQVATLTDFTQSGLANGDKIDTVVLTSAGTDAKAGVAGGPYAITASAAAGAAFDVRNYTVAYANGKLTVTPVPLTVTAKDATKKYDGLPFSGGNGVTFSSFVNGEDPSVLSGAPTYGGNAQNAVNANSYAITPGGLSSSNYLIAFVDGKLTIEKVPLNITANNASKTEDGAAFSGGSGVSYSGFVHNETEGVLGGSLSYSGFSQGARAVGSYAITPGGLTSDNYVISYADGILTINPPPPVYTNNTVTTTSNAPPVTGSSGLAQLTQVKLVVEVVQAPTTVAAPATPSTPPAAGSPGNPPASPSQPSSQPGSPPNVQPPVPTQQASAPPQQPPGTSQQPTPPLSTPLLGQSTPSTVQPPSNAPSAAQKPQPAAAPVAASTEPKEPSGTAEPEPPATESVKLLARSVAEATGTGTALEKLATSEVDLAVASGMPPAQARAAGEVFKLAVAAQLSKGVSPAVATARAAAVFKIEASFPKSPPQVTTARSFAASFNSSTAASSMKTLAGTSTGSGGTAFDQRLSNVLRAGANFAEAVSRAQAAGQIMDNLAKADATPRGTLTGSNSRPLPSMSGPQQKALGNLLALGIPPDQANRMATSVGAANAAAIQADARNPQVGMATGNIAAVKSSGAQPGFDKALAVAMLGGMPVQASIERAQRIETEMQRLAGADRNNPLSTLANGTSAPANASRNEDRALAQALLSGKSPAEAQAMAQKIAEILAPEKPSALTTLASGKSIETLLSSPGNSRTYRQVLSKALERGMPLGQAVNMATQAEAANAVRAPLPASVADMVKRNPATVAMASEQGAPLPSWLKFDAKTNSVVAFDPPPGALPLKVRITAGNQQAVVQVSDARQ